MVYYMKKWFNELLSEQSSVSMMRFMALMCTSTACLIGIIAIYRNANIEAAALLVSPFLTAGITGKVMQKSKEVSSGT